MIVDDIRMPSVRILYDFLNGEDEWELVTAFEVTAAFRRVKETVCVWDWADQRINKPHLDRFSQGTERIRIEGPTLRIQSVAGARLMTALPGILDGAGSSPG